MKEYETLLIKELRTGVILLTMNRPERSNALSTQMGRDLLDVFQRLERDYRDYRCVVLTGAGSKAFCAGGDLKERNSFNDDEWVMQHEVFERAFRKVLDCPLPVVAAVNGSAFGGGLELALLCDFIYASRTARFALPEVSLGIMPGGGGTQTLSRAVGERRAKELILTATPFTAADALQWGIVNKITEPEDLIEATLDTAARIAANAPISIRQAKHSIHFGNQMDLHSGMMFEIEAYQRMVSSEDRKEGVLAFNEARRPIFVGR